MLVASRANPFVFRDLLRQWCAIDALVEIAELCGFRLPDLAVTSRLTSKRMSNLVQNHLLDDVHVPCFNQVP